MEAGIGFDRAVESLCSIWGATQRGGVSLSPTECFNLIPLSV